MKFCAENRHLRQAPKRYQPLRNDTTRQTMKKLALILLTIITLTNAFGQTDKHGNPVFNNERISEEKFDNFELTSSYYNIKYNISNKQSSVYVSDNPTVADYLKFSRDLPSYFFIVHNGPNVMVMIMLLQKNDGSKTTLTYNIVNPNNGKSMEALCNVWGEISEKRVDELEKIKPDTSASILTMPNGRLYMFNGIGYRIQPYDKLKAEVIEIAKQLVSGGDKEEIKDPVEYIKKETIGGKLDFNKVLEKETQALFLYDGVAYNKKDFAIYLWGKKVKLLGIKSSKKATKLWEEINNRSLTDPERKALVSGFDSKAK
jgi:hypothetical protein